MPLTCAGAAGTLAASGHHRSGLAMRDSESDYWDDEPRALKHSGFGIASLLITIAAGVLEFILVVIAGVMESSTPGGMDEDSPGAALVGLGMIGGLFVDLIGIGFGIAGLCQARRNKLFPILGIVLGALVLFGVLALMVIGLLAE
jgi:hypothetical protein